MYENDAKTIVGLKAIGYRGRRVRDGFMRWLRPLAFTFKMRRALIQHGVCRRLYTFYEIT